MIFTVHTSEAEMRADVFVAKQYPQFSRSALQFLFKEQKVATSGQAIRPSYKVEPNQRIEVDDQALFVEHPLDIKVIYEDSDVIVLDKPMGILTHSKGSLTTEGTVATFIKPRLDKQPENNRMGIVHRLDRATSGVIITAKNPAALKFLQRQFSLRKVKKTYLAVVQGIPVPEEGVIDVPLARNPRNPKTFTAHPGGKSAATSYKVLNTQGGHSLLELKPQTGRTHQLRVHLAYVKHPILGDTLYGGEPYERLMLHAKSLELTLPNGERKIFDSPIPTEFKKYE